MTEAKARVIVPPMSAHTPPTVDPTLYVIRTPEGYVVTPFHQDVGVRVQDDEPARDAAALLERIDGHDVSLIMTADGGGVHWAAGHDVTAEMLADMESKDRIPPRPKPNVILLSDDDKDTFRWLSDGWCTEDHRRARAAIAAASDVPDAVRRLEEDGFTVTRQPPTYGAVGMTDSTPPTNTMRP